MTREQARFHPPVTHFGAPSSQHGFWQEGRTKIAKHVLKGAIHTSNSYPTKCCTGAVMSLSVCSG